MLEDFAKRELDRLVKDNDEIQQQINNDILSIVKLFSSQGHSGFSASYTLKILKRLLNWKPISILEDVEEDWDNGRRRGNNSILYQNKRCSSVFKIVDPAGNITYEDIDKCIVSFDGGITWFSSVSFGNEVEFPYYPPDEPEKIYIEYLDEDESKYDIITNDMDRINKLRDKKRNKYDRA